MEIYTNELLLGYPITKIRKIFIEGLNKFLDVSTVSKILSINEIEAKLLIEQLEKSGYLESYAKTSLWLNSTKGNILAHKLLKETISRESAKKKISEFLNRIEEVNINREFAFKVICAKLYGDYLSHDKTEIKSLNIIVELMPKEKDPSKQRELERIRRQIRKRHFVNIIESYFLPKSDVVDFLKSKSHNLYVYHDQQGYINTNRPFQIIYEIGKPDNDFL